MPHMSDYSEETNKTDKSGYLSLAIEPKKMNDVGMDEKMRYPTLYLDGKEDLLKGQVIGEMGEAVIKFKLSGNGLDVLAIKFMKGRHTEEPKKESKMSMKNEGSEM